MQKYIPLKSLRELVVGDQVRHRLYMHPAYTVTDNFGDRATAVRNVDITNCSEWEVLREVADAQRRWDGHAVWWIRRRKDCCNNCLDSTTEFLVTEIHSSGAVKRSDGKQIQFNELHEHERSHDRINWEKL